MDSCEIFDICSKFASATPHLTVYFFQTEEMFLDMFEDEFREMMVGIINTCSNNHLVASKNNVDMTLRPH